MRRNSSALAGRARSSRRTGSCCRHRNSRRPRPRSLPHLASVHTLGAPSHFLPSSTRQRSEQPSPATTLASSHCSLAATMPSPQRAISRHGLPGLGQLNPRSTIRQAALQPSPESLLPSSHASSEVRLPSPQPGGVTCSGRRHVDHDIVAFPSGPGARACTLTGIRITVSSHTRGTPGYRRCSRNCRRRR